MTIGQTSIKVSQIIDHAIRRIGLPVELQTPEIVEIAKNNLYFVMMNYANRGVPLWCIDEQYLVLVEGKAKYSMPDGTVDILNANYRTVTEVTGTDTSDATSYITQFSVVSDVVMMYLDTPNTSVTISKSTDGITYTTVSTITVTSNPNWYSIDGVSDTTYIKLSHATALTVTDVKWYSSYRDTPMYRLNRDDYSTIPNKNSQGIPLQYWFDRQLVPVMLMWPVPNSTADNNTIWFYRQHQVEDVGNLNTSLTLPPRWLEATVWQLAKLLAFELPQVAPERLQACVSMAQNALQEAEMEERDNSPISIAPDIGVYTS